MKTATYGRGAASATNNQLMYYYDLHGVMRFLMLCYAAVPGLNAESFHTSCTPLLFRGGGNPALFPYSSSRDPVLRCSYLSGDICSRVSVKFFSF